MLRLISVRIAAALLVMLGACTLVFLLIHLVPGDPVEAMLGETAHPADREAMRRALGLDAPLWRQYVDYLSGLAQLNLGESLRDQRSVSAILCERLPATLMLAIASLLLAIAIAVPLGVVAARHHNSTLDSLVMGFSLLGVAVPNFWLGPLLILVFSLWLGLTPVSGMQHPASLILPAVTLGTGLAAVLARMVRSAVLEVLAEDYVRTARAKGMSEQAVMRRHALRNAWLPVLTLLGLQLGALLGGAVITETVFAWPGIGSLLIEAIQARDFPVVQGTVLVIAALYVSVNTATDLAYVLADPRVRLG